VITFFTHKWVVQLIGIIAISILIWFVGPLVAIAGHTPLESDLSRLIVIIVIILLWVLNLLRIQLMANRASAQMVSELTSSPSSSDESMLAEQVNADIAKIESNFTEALQLLKKGSKNTQGKNYLYDLPWYIIIGPPGSGKTTALKFSGLDFPLADKFGKAAINGVGGTRNCDWFFTDQAVLIDTAGRYVTQDSHESIDKAGWLGFLSLLKKYRPRRPVNGVLITMSLADLLKTAEERSLHAQAIRKRIEELHTQFGIRFPVYMIFTKADLIAGFNDFFAHLRKEEREQVWGVTFTEENPQEPVDVLVQVGKDFDDLMTRINLQLPRRLQEERDLQRRHLIFGFPQRMSMLRENLLTFLQECYGANRYQSLPYLRGVYFTSGTQEGTPIDRLMGVIADTFKLDRFSVPLLSGQGKSFFITNLLKEVIFDEALIVGVNPRLERFQTLLRHSIYTGVSVLIVLLGGLWLTSFNKNQSELTSALQKIAEYEETAKFSPNWQTKFEDLLVRLNKVQTIQSVYPNDVAVLNTMGLYQGDKLKPVMSDTYNELLQRAFLPLIKTRLEKRLQENFSNPDMLYSLLEVYLMLGESKRLKPELLIPWIVVDWENTYANNLQTQKQLAEHLSNLVKLPPESQQLNEHLVAAARQILNRIPIAQQIYMRIKNDALQTDQQAFKLIDAVGVNAIRVFNTKIGSIEQQTIPYFFTYDGFYNLFLEKSKEQINETVSGNWVLANTDKTINIDSEQLADLVNNYYYQDYIKEWDDLLANIKIKSTSNAAQATEVLEFVARPDSPLKKLLETVNKETSLTVKPAGAEDITDDALKKATAANGKLNKLLQAAKTVGSQPIKPMGSVVEEHFLSLTNLVRGANGTIPLDRTLQLLGQLYGCMIDLSGTSNVGGVAMDKAKQGGCGDVVAKMKRESDHLSEPLKAMTQTLATGNQDIIMDSSKGQLEKLWQSEVMPLYQTGIQGLYPFSRVSSKEVTLEDFGRFFAQGGVIDSFFTKNLQSFVDISGSKWQMISQNNQAIAVSNASLVQIQLAFKIKQMFFANGGMTPTIKFTIKPLVLDQNVNSFWLNIEGQQIKYSQGEMAKNVPLQWPGTDGSRLVSFGFETKDGKKIQKDVEGQWSWFKTLELTHLQKQDQIKYLLTFEVEGYKAQYELNANSVDNPFSFVVFDNFRLKAGL
jgi:type VI secretion system protein ImpL